MAQENAQNGRTLSAFDRAIGSLDGIPGVDKTKATTIVAVTPMVGDAQTFIVQTYRQRDVSDDGVKSGDWLFVQYVAEGVTTRIALPPQVTGVIARQRDALATRARKRAARDNAADRKARGELPGFMKNPGRGGRKRKAKRHGKRYATSLNRTEHTGGSDDRRRDAV